MSHDGDLPLVVHDMLVDASSTAGIDAHIFSRRARFHALQHLAVRAYELAAAREAGSKLQAAAAICSALYDVAAHRALKRTDRPLLAVRSLTGAVDTAAWSLSLPGDYEVATLVGIGPAVEAGIRYGLAATLVPFPSIAATALARRARGLPLGIQAFGAQLLAAVAGAGFGAFRTRWTATNYALAREQVAAKQHQSRIAGMSQVAIGADTILDALTSSLVPMGHAGLSPLWKRITGWKQHLSDQLASAGATYLEVAVRAWATDRNRRTHHLSNDVRIGALTPNGAGTVLLTGTQPADLVAALDALDLSGDVDVRVLDHAGARIHGGPKRIRVGQHTIEVPPDLYGTVDPLDPDLAILIAGAAWSIGAANKTCIGPPAALIGPLSYAASAFGIRRLAAQDRKTAFHAIMASLASAGVTTACMGVAGRYGTPRRSDARGRQVVRMLPFACSLDAPALLIGVHWEELSKPQRVLATAGATAVMLLGIGLAPRPIRARDVALQLLWPLNSAITAIDLSSAFTSEAARRSSEVDDALRKVSSISEQQGRDDVRALLEAALSEAQDLYDSLLSELARSGQDPAASRGVGSEVAARLGVVARRLEELKCKEGSLS